MVVAVTPVFGHAPDLTQCGEYITVKHFGAERAIEAFDVGILGRLAGLDMHPLDAVLLRPLLQRGADELGAVVQPQAPWSTSQLDQLIRARITRSEGRLLWISIFSNSRLKSSLTLKVRNRRPDHSASAMKSADQVWLAVSGTSSGSRIRSGNRRLPRRGKSTSGRHIPATPGSCRSPGDATPARTTTRSRGPGCP